MRGRAFDAWFLAVADPARAAPPPRCPRGLEPARLCDFADRHGVLPAVTRSLRRTEARDAGQRAVLAEAEERLRRRVGFALLLRKQLEPVAAAFAEAGLSAVVLKGRAFADRLYAEPFLRPFTDLDFLLPRDALADAAPVLERLGYRRAPEPRGKYPGQYGEQTWRLADPKMGAVELHWNLVNSPPLRRRCSVALADLAVEGPAAGGLARPTASSLLLIAAVHAAAGHRFDRLQPLCDVVQAARGAAGPMDEDWLAETAGRTGSAFAVATALRLAGAAFGEPACADLAARVRPGGRDWLERRLITPRTVLHAQAVGAGLRRQLLRELLKRT
ncbi:MAG: nucleotidyltransferase family protein [bacterium]